MFNPLSDESRLLRVSSVAVFASVGFAVAVHRPASAASLIPVNVELSLLVDVSGSISPAEYALQMGGYQSAFTTLAPLFDTGEFGSVAVNLIQWSGATQQSQSIPWTLINDQTSALQFADLIGTLPRAFSGITAPGSAIQFATPLFSSNDYQGQRWIIDVSGDSQANSGISTSLARDNALAAGVSAINGLPINSAPRRDGTPSALDVWYANNIQGGDGSFIMPAYGFEDVGRALEQKLRLELTPPPPPTTDVPEPATILGIALVGGGLACIKRRRLV